MMICRMLKESWPTRRNQADEMTSKHYPQSVKKEKLRLLSGKETDRMYDIPDGIIADITADCQGNVHGRKVTAVAVGSFEHITVKNKDHPKRVDDLGSNSNYYSDCRNSSEDLRCTRNNWGLSEAKQLCAQSEEVPGLSNHRRALITFVGLRGGSRVTGGISVRGLANVAVQDWSHDLTFLIGDRRYHCRSSVAQFLSPLVSKFYSIVATISELRLEAEDRDE
jgi:hypothetical protein